MPTDVAAPEVAPAPAQAAHAQPDIDIMPRDIRRTPEFRKTFKAFEAKARQTGTQPDPNPPKTKPEVKATPEPKAKPTDPAIELGEEPEGAAGADGETQAEETEDGTTPEVKDDNTKPDANAATDPKESKGKKLSPWRLVEQWKSKATQLEKELAEAKTKPPTAQADSKEITERLTKAESRAKELEDEIRYVNYQKSPEFLEKYQKPYETAFKRAVAELGEVSVTDAAGNARPATAEDMLALVSLPLGKARELADQTFGAFADDAMGHRKEIKNLFEQRQAAIEEAKTTGAARDQQRAEQMQKQQAEVGKAITETWNRANVEATTDPKYGQFFTPREGDQEWNQRLAKGFELVDKAFNDANPRDPRLTPEERERVVRRHAAVRHRAAAFGPLRFENEQLRGKVTELETALEAYKSTEPGSSGGSRGKPAVVESGYTFDKLKEGLRKYAK